MRILVANITLFILYALLAMTLTWLYVRWGQPHDSLLFGLIAPLMQFTSLPVACYVNWRLLPDADPTTRLIKAIAIASLAIVLAVAPYGMIILNFHLWIGGSL